jgi:hypothetical protein
MSRNYGGPSLNSFEKRDPFFERLVRDEFSSIEVMGVDFQPVDIIQLDPEAYEDIRRERISNVHEQIRQDLSSESYRRLEMLASLIPKGGVVPFVGAGMSASSGYPSWGAYLQNLAVDWLDTAVVDQHLKNGEYEALAEAIQKARGASSFEESLADFDRGFQPSEEDFILFDLFKGSMVTTNFDDLLEKASTELGLQYVVREGSGQWAGWGRESNAGAAKVLLKLHGHHTRPQSRVLLKEQYEEAYGTNGPALRDLRALLTTNCVLFLGCSLADDRTMHIAQQLHEAQAVGESPRHYAFLARNGEQQIRERFLTARGIFPIWYPNDEGDHAMLGQMLWWLKDAIASLNQ